METATTHRTPSELSPDLTQLTAARDHYRDQFGWPVSVDVHQQRLLVEVGEALDTVTVPASLGEKVHTELRIAMLAGPVIAESGGRWWTFLVQPDPALRPDLRVNLHRLKVYLTPSGADVIIPTQVEGTGNRYWVEQPHPHRPLPPWSAVIATTRRVAAMSISVAAVNSPTTATAVQSESRAGSESERPDEVS